MQLVLAFDLATTSGFCAGAPGSRSPAHGSHRLANEGASHEAIFGAALVWCDGLVKQHQPSLVVYEAPLSTNWKSKRRKTSRKSVRILNGLPAILEAVCYLRRVTVRQAETSDVRGHFAGARGLVRDDAKRATIESCRRLGINPIDDNDADAIATWHYACSLIDGAVALEASPLFRRAG